MLKHNYLRIIFGLCLVSMPSWGSTGSDLDGIPLVGTDQHGHTYPGATVPFGMVQLSPDTPKQGWDACSGYHYSDSVINGFSHTHLSGTGCGGLGDVLLMPTVGEINLDTGTPGHGYASRFSHDQETARPGYYHVFLEDPKVTVDLTATARCGFHKYTFPASGESHVILDLAHAVGGGTRDSSLRMDNDTTISGSRSSDDWGGVRDVYFVIQFSKPFSSFGIEENGKRLPGGASSAQGKDVKAFVNYQTTQGEVILVKVGISPTSIEGARKNLAAEIPGWDFDAVEADAARQWNKVLNLVQIESPDPHIRKTFYANLYQTCLAPVMFDDVDGTYRGYDHQNHPGSGFVNYTTFSIWDIYRAEWPLMGLLHPDRVNDMVQSMLAEYRQLNQHSIPIWPFWGNETWCMIGYHSADMMTEAYLDGFRGFDAEAAYQAMRDTAMQDRNGLGSYKKLGYVPSARGEQATSHTLEYTVDDWCIARMAESLGHEDDAKMFYQRAANYYNVFDGTTKFFRGREADGSWRAPFTTTGLVGDEYTEADAWQYAFAAQQDIPGMIRLYGGDEGFIDKLDAMFNASSFVDSDDPDISGMVGQYSQGDEQSHHVAYLYNYAGAPYKTQQHVRQIMSEMYGDTPSGECGNVDCGQMAAWYVWSALGLYPVNPSSGIYIIGSPVVNKAVVHLDPKYYKGKKFIIIAKHNGPQNIYIQSVSLNGKPLSRSWLYRDEIISGGTLKLVMGPKPNLVWGSAVADRPPATMPADFQYPKLPAPSSTGLVALPVPIRIICGSDESSGDFLPDPNAMSGNMAGSQSAIDTQVANAAPEAVYQSERYGKKIDFVFPGLQPAHYLVRLHFAEVFDGNAGERIEDVQINNQLVLSNLDIFVAAGGMNKALVKDIPNVVPDGKGKISICVSSTEASPDHNAKISGIEILPES